MAGRGPGALAKVSATSMTVSYGLPRPLAARLLSYTALHSLARKRENGLPVGHRQGGPAARQHRRHQRRRRLPERSGLVCASASASD